MAGFDKEVEKTIMFWQKEKECMILISRVDGTFYMDVMYPVTGRVDEGIVLSGADENKYKLITAIRDYFKA